MKIEHLNGSGRRFIERLSAPITKVKNSQGEIVPASKSQMLNNAIYLTGFGAFIGYMSFETADHMAQAFSGVPNSTNHLLQAVGYNTAYYLGSEFLRMQYKKI